jgi:hypothetical protein
MLSSDPLVLRRVKLVQWLADFRNAYMVCQDFRPNSSFAVGRIPKRSGFCGRAKGVKAVDCSGHVFGLRDDIVQGHPGSFFCPCAHFEPILEPFFVEVMAQFPWEGLTLKIEKAFYCEETPHSNSPHLTSVGPKNWRFFSEKDEKKSVLAFEMGSFLLRNLSDECFEFERDVFSKVASLGSLTDQQKLSLSHYRALTRAVQIVRSQSHYVLNWVQLRAWKSEGRIDFSMGNGSFLRPKSLVLLNLLTLKLKGPGAESADQDLFEELVHRLYDLDCGIFVFGDVRFFEESDEPLSRIVPDVHVTKGSRKRVVWRDRIVSLSCEGSLPWSGFQRLATLLVKGQEMLKQRGVQLK